MPAGEDPVCRIPRHMATTRYLSMTEPLVATNAANGGLGIIEFVSIPSAPQSMQLAPSSIYSPANLVTNAIWARPYIGAGISIYHSTLRSTLGVPVAVDNALGSQAFGGAELTWAHLPQFALSADLRQQWAPPPFNGFEPGGFGFSMSADWYVR